MSENKVDALKVLERAELSSVEFIRDYVQLRFDGPTLTAITPPLVRTSLGIFRIGSCEYRNELCGLIGVQVRRAVTREDQEIRIEFENEAWVSVSLRPEDYRAAEAAIFSDDLNPTCVW